VGRPQVLRQKGGTFGSFSWIRCIPFPSPPVRGHSMSGLSFRTKTGSLFLIKLLVLDLHSLFPSPPTSVHSLVRFFGLTEGSYPQSLRYMHIRPSSTLFLRTSVLLTTGTCQAFCTNDFFSFFDFAFFLRTSFLFPHKTISPLPLGSSLFGLLWTSFSPVGPLSLQFISYVRLVVGLCGWSLQRNLFFFAQSWLLLGLRESSCRCFFSLLVEADYSELYSSF